MLKHFFQRTISEQHLIAFLTITNKDSQVQRKSLYDCACFRLPKHFPTTVQFCVLACTGLYRVENSC